MRDSFLRDPSKLLVIAGPCVVESADLLNTVASHLQSICRDLPVQLVFKSSYRKANRTSAGTFQGIGDIEALEMLHAVGVDKGLPLLTDIHTDEEAAIAAEYVDVLQIPAFLSRQTSLLEAAAKTGRIVNIKKGQFMAPEDMSKAAQKVIAAGNNNVWVTERGTTFGYHDLIVDFRSLVIMKQTGFPVIFDATHSIQQPSVGVQSGGRREFAPALARAAAAVGIDGLFFETHPDPKSALSDAATQLPLEESKAFLQDVVDIWLLRR